MLQSSQIEKPRCSATIDQMRLRRAMYLPVDSQNFSFSGFQSEIQLRFRLLISMFLCGRDWSPLCRGQPFPGSFERSCHEPVLGLGRASPTWLFDFLYQARTVGVPLFVEIGRHSLRVFKSNLNDTRVSL